MALINELAEQNAALAELDELKDNFLSSVSHELRTPLTAIKGSAELLLDDEGASPEVQKQFLTIINVESDRLTRLINDVLDLARYEAGQEVWNDAPNPLSNIVESTVAGTQSLAIQKSLDIGVNLDPDLPDVWCDQDKVNQVLTNLLSNAIKFTPENGEIGISAKELTTTSNGRVVEIKVSDNGIGMPKGELQEIFQKFKQIGDTPADIQKGTGLGLPICKEIIAHYAGNIWAESEIGKGSVFTFTLPVEKKVSEPDQPLAGDSGPPVIQTQ